jgi:hypothetical protein
MIWRPPDPLQLELTDWLDLHGLLDLHQHPPKGGHRRRGVSRGQSLVAAPALRSSWQLTTVRGARVTS